MSMTPQPDGPPPHPPPSPRRPAGTDLRSSGSCRAIEGMRSRPGSARELLPSRGRAAPAAPRLGEHSRWALGPIAPDAPAARVSSLVRPPPLRASLLSRRGRPQHSYGPASSVSVAAEAAGRWAVAAPTGPPRSRARSRHARSDRRRRYASQGAAPCCAGPKHYNAPHAWPKGAARCEHVQLTEGAAPHGSWADEVFGVGMQSLIGALPSTARRHVGLVPSDLASAACSAGAAKPRRAALRRSRRCSRSPNHPFMPMYGEGRYCTFAFPAVTTLVTTTTVP